VSNPRHQAGNEVVRASRTLSALGLVTAFGHVSQRADSVMVITPAADLGCVTESALVDVDLSAASLPPGAPAEAWAHLAVYRARPDVTAVARAQPPAAFAAAAALSGEVQASARPSGPVMPADPPVLPLLHGQGCWLGEPVPVHQDARLLRSAELAAAAVSLLGQSDALLLRGNGALTCGASPGLAVARMWLLSVACETWLAAAACGTPRLMGQAEADAWRAVAGELLPRLWLHLSRKAGDNDATANGGS
jgi:HCOMODA/2-hydroxy-3-carboxy-muconic semialdehyde decarboxylase